MVHLVIGNGEVRGIDVDDRRRRLNLSPLAVTLSY